MNGRPQKSPTGSMSRCKENLVRMFKDEVRWKSIEEFVLFFFLFLDWKQNYIVTRCWKEIRKKVSKILLPKSVLTLKITRLVNLVIKSRWEKAIVIRIHRHPIYTVWINKVTFAVNDDNIVISSNKNLSTHIMDIQYKRYFFNQSKWFFLLFLCVCVIYLKSVWN